MCQNGSTWPDVARDAIAFAREDPDAFILILGVLGVFFLFVGTAAWLALPRVAEVMKQEYNVAREAKRERLIRDR